jgi:hypothetical protein
MTVVSVTEPAGTRRGLLMRETSAPGAEMGNSCQSLCMAEVALHLLGYGATSLSVDQLAAELAQPHSLDCCGASKRHPL